MRGTLDINRESNIHAAARTMQTPISIHALHEESDTTANVMLRMLKFQSTLSMRRATGAISSGLAQRAISIHALHEESDVTSAATRSACSIFQSTLSMRRATAVALQNPAGVRFQSTLSMRRATQCARHCTQSFPISIHALHEESDLRRTDVEQHRKISIHALHEESDKASSLSTFVICNFNPRSP